ncbi:methylenetetrahydrofolate--tRNA-(uracil(54)-C(5))-methyltransferase (FADH(2)-oxidizing) TrmFO [Geothrix sp. PMB-07]|uniref:methylenetetrahydrofolate--tRNA-(uracil(54)- C(5))-methyltransferase (FADH(2)-oxidizing) TrmFO n=1 Tax=Geothrix sp. PMB-07 TaxID=3068640 RepID=UPI0027410D86|nr:methylenetetrahydrofolate--tRNA-(uracil(54)-C(5))-methyltransferase (FADH(2)-oxidizing) TrmFO [Geothrix sp. PMB-07]WLT32929.1 methylenetetrahydrofolate--tRNA-(uracil(54)-C(5))-methyltransferase (FADH(2)-oxidizing) TrmFO [Geothrix sp. PMB-07]
MIHIIGAGLAGSEAAWQLANRGHQVLLTEMRPLCHTAAHTTDQAAEMVCSNSFKSDDPNSATGILKAEMQRMDSLILRCAEDTRVPAGNSLAVDRVAFSSAVTQALRTHPNIRWETAHATDPDLNHPTILATGPLTSEPLTAWLSAITGCGQLHFYDAIAPIVDRDSIDMDIAWMAARYDKGGPDFINCPLNKSQYETFLDALLAAERAPLHDLDTPYFEACLPIEVMADRGRETLRHGPMKPVGLDDPRTGHWPHAVVQLRQDTLAGEHFNLVGFQTRLKWGAQKEVFRFIPGLAQAEFARFGSIHRNTYLQAPQVLDSTLHVKSVPNLWVAGQLSGVEGYLESAAGGLAAAFAVNRAARNLPALPFPKETVLGSLLHYLAHASTKDFGPTNAMLGLLPPLPDGEIDIRGLKRSGGLRAVKAAKGAAHRQRALASLEAHLRESN